MKHTDPLDGTSKVSAPKKPIASSQLRSFGLVFGAILIGLFGLLLPWLLERPLPIWPWYIAVPLAIFALLWPRALIVIYTPWMKFGLVAGWINTRIILFVLFYLIIAPTAIIMRLFGFDPLKKKFDSTADSYRVVNEPQPHDHMEKPY